MNVQVISTVPVMFCYDAQPKHCLELARHLNNDVARQQSEHPRNVIGLGTVPMQHADTAIGELPAASSGPPPEEPLRSAFSIDAAGTVMKRAPRLTGARLSLILARPRGGGLEHGSQQDIRHSAVPETGPNRPSLEPLRPRTGEGTPTRGRSPSATGIRALRRRLEAGPDHLLRSSARPLHG